MWHVSGFRPVNQTEPRVGVVFNGAIDNGLVRHTRCGQDVASNGLPSFHVEQRPRANFSALEALKLVSPWSPWLDGVAPAHR